MAGFSIAPIVAAQMAVMKNPAMRGGGGGSGKPPKDDDLFPKWAFYLLAIMFAAMIILVFLQIAFTKEQTSYVVDGALVGYENKTSGKTKKVFVNILQSDGKIRKYNTGTKPGYCNYHVLGIGIQVIVTPYHNAIFNQTTYRSQLAVDPCAK